MCVSLFACVWNMDVKLCVAWLFLCLSCMVASCAVAMLCACVVNVQFYISVHFHWSILSGDLGL